jgi:hypothetical protein
LIFILTYTQSTDGKKAKESIVLNRIKNQNSWDYNYVGDQPQKTGVKTSVTTYSTTGDISQVTTYNAKGQILHIEKFNYDTQGNKIEYSRYTGGSETQAAYQKISRYNDRNQLTDENGFDGVENFKNVYTYNTQGDLIEIRYMKNNVLQEKRIFYKNGNITTVSIYNTIGILISKLVLKYDNTQNLIEETVYGVNQSELERKTYNYDDKKNLKEEAKYKLNKVTLKTTYNYNTAGDLLEIIEESPSTIKFVKKSYTYDPEGNLCEIKWRRNGKEDYNRIIYTYDPNGISNTADTFYPATKYRVLTKYVYEYY